MSYHRPGYCHFCETNVSGNNVLCPACQKKVVENEENKNTNNNCGLHPIKKD